MEIKLTWFERLMELEKKQCLPLGDTPKATIYSAIHYNKKEIKAAKKKFRVQTDDDTGAEYVCRVK